MAIGFAGGSGSFLTKRSGFLLKAPVEGYLPGGMDLVGQTVMHLVGRHQADASMVMVLIVPVEEAATEGLCVLDAAEALRELRLIFHGFEVAFRERVVVGGVRPAVGFGDAEIGEQQCRGLGAHRTATVGVQSELALRRGMFGSGVLEQAANRVALSRVGDTPADDPPAEDVDDDVEIEVGPFGGPISLVMSQDQTSLGACGEEFGLLVDGMAQLLAALPDLAVLQPGSGTWCGSSSGRGLRRAG